MATTIIGKIGTVYKGEWSALDATYNRLDEVSYLGSTYRVILPTGFVPAGTLPTNTTYFKVSAQGVDVSTIQLLQYPTIEAANAAITNTVVNGKNSRDGKIVQIGSAGNYTSYTWKGGFEDVNLIVKEITSENLPTFLQAEISRPSNEIVSFGVPLIGTLNDGVGGKFRFNLNAKVTANGIVKQLLFHLETAGTIEFCIGSTNGTYFTYRKSLGVISGVVGLNTLVLNEPISTNEIVAVRNGIQTARIKYGLSGAPGNNFIQMEASTNPPASGADGSYYSYSFSVEVPAEKPLDIFAKAATVAEQMEAAKSYTDQKVSDSLIVPSKTIIRVKRNGTVGVDCEFTGNNAIQDALDSITDASYKKQYKIIYEGVFEALTAADFKAEGRTNDGSGSDFVAFVKGKSYVSLLPSGRDKAIIRGYLPDNLGTGTSFKYYLFQTVYWHSNFGELGGTITGQNVRYPLHIDGGRSLCKDFYSKLKNLRVEHYGNTGNAVAVWNNSFHPIGLGMSDGQVIEYENVVTRSLFWPLYIHTNENFTLPSSNRYKNCRFESAGGSLKKAAQFQSMGSHRDDEIVLDSCVFEGGYIVDANDDPYIPTALSDQHYNHCDLRITGSNNSPILWKPNFNGKALRFISKSTGVASSVRFDINSTAFATIIKDKDYGSGNYISDFGETNTDGYAYRDGDVSIKGYSIGRLDIGGEAYGLAKNTYGKSLGKRLGDCSTVNKTLSVIIDGVTYNIVFNKNYIGAGTASAAQSAYTNAQILTEIIAVVGGVCDVSEYAVGNDYYPELSDVMHRAKSTNGAVILKGMAVYYDNGVIRKATNTDTQIYGIALDDIKNSGYGRVLVKGLISTAETDRFSTLQETYSAVVKGEQLGISATTGKLSKTATIKLFTAIADNVLAINTRL